MAIRIGATVTFRLLIAAAFVVVATLANMALRFLLATNIVTPLYLAASMMAAWIGGLQAGLIAVAMATVMLNVAFLTPPAAESEMIYAAAAVRTLLFVGSATLINSLVEARRRAEAEEHARRIWYEAMLTSVDDGVLATGPDGRISFMNAAAEELTGWPRAEAIGLPIEQVAPIEDGKLDPETELLGPARRALRDASPAASGARADLVDRSGRRRPIDGRAAPIRPSGGWREPSGTGPGGVVLVLRDVADRREAERATAELAAIVDGSEDAIIGHDVEGRITSWNPGAERVFGHTAHEAIGREIDALLPEEREEGDGAEPRPLDRGGLGSGEIRRIGRNPESIRTAKDGRQLVLSLSTSPRRDAQGRVVGASTIARDVTDRRQAEHRLSSQHAVSRILSESATLARAIPRVLEAVAQGLRREVAIYWTFDRETGRLGFGDVWQKPGALPPDARFVLACRPLSFAPGEGLPGRVWASNEAAWVVEIAEDDRFSRREAATADGLHAGVAFPICRGDEVIGVIEFFGTDPQPPDPATLRMLVGVASQIGLFAERKRAEAELRVVETRFRRLSDSGILGILVADLDRRVIVEANDAFLGLVAAARSDLDEGRLGWELLTSEESREADDWALAQLRLGGACDPYLKEFVRLDGERLAILIGSAMLEEGSPLCIAFLIDVTERRRTEESLRHREEMLRLAMDVARMGTWDWDIATGEVTWSDNLESIHGFSPAKFGGTLAGFAELIHPEDLPGMRLALARAIAGRNDFQVEFRMKSAAGEALWLDGRGRIFRDDSGRPVRLVGVGLDITGRKRSQRDLQVAKEEAVAANRSKDHFLAVLSHELRTPLSPVLTAVSAMLEDPATPADYRTVLGMIRRNVELEARLIDDLLDVTMIAQGKLRLKTEVVDAHDLLSQALEICMPDLKAKGLRHEVALSARRHHVVADPARLQQVFWNLIRNAMKFTPVGGRIAVRTGDGIEGRLVVEVEDDGLGIEPHVLSKIFDAFEQGEASITRRFGGMGLGLAISRSVVEGLGGRLTASSPGRDQGSTFSLDLAVVDPPTPPSSASPPARAPRAEGFAAKTGSGRSLRILLVEDNEDSLHLLTRLLRRRGHEVTPAESVAAALSAAGCDDDPREFDLLISDLGLPDGSGYDIARGLAERGRPLPLAIALSGFGGSEDLRQSREAGFAVHLVKPVDLAQIDDAIRIVTSPPPEHAPPPAADPRPVDGNPQDRSAP